MFDRTPAMKCIYWINVAATYVTCQRMRLFVKGCCHPSWKPRRLHWHRKCVGSFCFESNIYFHRSIFIHQWLRMCEWRCAQCFLSCRKFHMRWKYIIIHMIHIILWIGTFLVLGPLWLSTKSYHAEKIDDILLLVWRLPLAFPPLADDPRSQPRCCELSLVILRLWILRGAVILDLALVNSCALLLVLYLRDRRMIEEMAPVRPPCFLLLRLSVASSSVKAWGHKQVSSSSLSVASSSRSTAQDITQRDSISIYFARVYISFFERFSTSGRLPLTSLRIRDQEEQDPFPM